MSKGTHLKTEEDFRRLLEKTVNHVETEAVTNNVDDSYLSVKALRFTDGTRLFFIVDELDGDYAVKAYLQRKSGG